MTTTNGLLAVPGGALVALEELRRNSRPAESALFLAVVASNARTDLAHLRTVARLCNLPMPRMVWNASSGISGTFRGSDKRIAYAVDQWSEAFAIEAVIVEPGPWRMPDGKPVITPGWAVVSASVGSLDFTVGGRLVEVADTR